MCRKNKTNVDSNTVFIFKFRWSGECSLANANFARFKMRSVEFCVFA